MSGAGEFHQNDRGTVVLNWRWVLWLRLIGFTHSLKALLLFSINGFDFFEYRIDIGGFAAVFKQAG